MTEGQVVSATAGTTPSPRHRATSPAPTEQSSGVAQSVVGARPSDEVAAGEEPGEA